jgi:hypothetical protein
MKSIRMAVPFAMLLAAVLAVAQSGAEKEFTQLKSLSGTWEGKTSKGESTQVQFKVTGNGSALMSEILGHHDDMISMFHLDGPDKLLMTHYCGAGNQPRMKATTSTDGKTITFDFLDATNLDGKQAGHMRHLVIALVDENHHTEEWTFAAANGGEMKELFDLWRKK